MAEIKAEFTTQNDVKEKAANALGLNQKSVFDIVRREDYINEAAYIKALAETSKAMETPEYQRAARKAAEEEKRMSEERVRATQRAEFQAIRQGVTLTPLEQQRVDEQAAELARRDLAAGRIFASDMGRTIEEYASELGNRAKDEKATSVQFNSFIRAELKNAKSAGD